MEQKTADAMNACAVLGAAFAMGCAPEGAAPIALDATTGIPKTPQGCNAYVGAVLKAIDDLIDE